MPGSSMKCETGEVIRLTCVSQHGSLGQPSTPTHTSPEKSQRTNKNDETQEISAGIRRITGKYDCPSNFVTMADGSLGSPLASPDRNSQVLGELDSSPTFPNNGVPIGATAPSFMEGVEEKDLLQVEMFYRSHKTEVHVCQCLANLYFGTVKTAEIADQWQFAATGIPVLLLDTGDHLRKRRLNIIMAEKGTGFVLWKDVIDHLTCYRAPHDNFHTLHMSTDHTKLAGLSFDDKIAAANFFKTYIELTSNPEDDILNIGRSKKKKKEKQKKGKYKAPRKTEISQPCCFVHVTSLERPALDTSSDFDHVTEQDCNQRQSVSDLASSLERKLKLRCSDSISSGISDSTTSASADSAGATVTAV